MVVPLDKEESETKVNRFYDRSEFLELVQDLREKGDIEPAIEEIIQSSSESPEIKNMLKVVLYVEIFSMVLYSISMGSFSVLKATSDAGSEKVAGVAIEVMAVWTLVKIIRGAFAGVMAYRKGIPLAPVFGIGEALPNVGRLTPVFWFPKHVEFMKMFLLYQKVKRTRRKIKKEPEDEELKERELEIVGKHLKGSRLMNVVGTVIQNIRMTLAPK